jgi:hypothetical protein
MRRTLPLLAAALLLAAGCDSSGPDVDRDFGRSTLSVTGSYTDQFTGSAGFTVVTDAEGRTGFVVMLYDGNMNDEESITRVATFSREGARPPTGTYAIGLNEVMAFFAAEITPEESVIIGGEEGELVITSSSASMVKGTFTFTGVPMGDEEPAVVSGTFEAPSFPMIGL